jgi:hypothetical protein
MIEWAAAGRSVSYVLGLIGAGDAFDTGYLRGLREQLVKARILPLIGFTLAVVW